MKRFLLLFLALTMLLSVSACAAEHTAVDDSPASSPDTVYVYDGFADVDSDDWFAGSVDFVREKGIMNGTGADRFSPNDSFTRAQLATVLYRIAGDPEVSGEDSFSDTVPGEWYGDAVLWAEQSGVVNGIGGGKFAPADPVTQEQLVTMPWRMEGEPEGEAAEDASPYAAIAAEWARAKGIASATDEYTFTPKDNATRAQVAALLMGYLVCKDESGAELISLTLDGQPVAVDWEDNPSVDALRDLLRDGPLTVELSPYGGFEQVGSLGASLPRSDEQTTTGPGDIVLYSGSNMVIFYGSNSWAYTRLGHITDRSPSELKALLDTQAVTAVLSLDGKMGSF